ncbi:MAG: BolA family protein [Gammaproteobacteria bacterium]|nr:MAG: BolA family transcriptional regulator [Gammaproteobacteria bacterium TMED236]
MSPYDEIVTTLNNLLNVESMFLENESGMHNVPIDSETHFKLIIVSDDFVEMTKVKRHQLIYQSLVKTMKKIHALSIQAFTIEEFNRNPLILSSPDCANK